MNRYRIVSLGLAAGLLALTCTGCGAADTSAPSAASSVPYSAVSPAVPAASSAAAASSAPAASSTAVSGRAPTTMLTFFAEGEAEQLPATLYVGAGYSFYLPDEGWTADDPNHWVKADNPDVTFSVQQVTGVSLQTYLEDQVASGMTQSDDNDLELYAVSGAEPGQFILASVTPSGDSLWVFTCSYPNTSEYGEGVAAILASIADSFAPDQPA